MPSQLLIEDRLKILEKEVADLKRRLGSDPSSADWLGRVAGSMKEMPEFDEVLALGRAARVADRPDGEP